MKINKKIIFSATVSMVAAGIMFVAPAIASAQTATNASLQAQIQALLQQIASLQAQVQTSPSSAPLQTALWCHDFNTNLKVGAQGSEVTALQMVLSKDGETVSTTGYFGPLTKAAVVAFQNKYKNIILTPNGLSSGTGIVGAATRSELNAMFDCANVKPTTPGIQQQAPTQTTTTPAPIISTTTITLTPAPTTTPVPAPTVTTTPSQSYGLSGQPLGGSVHTKQGDDSIGEIDLKVSPSGPIAVNKITVTFSGSLATPAVIGSASLSDVSDVDVTEGDGATFSTSTNSATWTFGSGPNGLAISAGSSYSFSLSVASDATAGQAGVSQTLSASIQNSNDFRFTTSLDSAGVTVGVPSYVVPIILNSITYPVGE